ncbi:hypothetical protein GH714_002859 [Hevea brasiliensis]|uniref:Exonuclease V n=1 Tax=Hevea brasiliensis TaxID=3981 RepID=A0A6A6N8U0_HEVBR|nr:hypothetical protein GH714_002859 [Hevea brasiliensis]
MTESPSQDANDVATTNPSVPEIPIEIVSEEEMALIEAALAATRSCLSSSVFPAICSPSSSSLFLNNARSIRSITSLSKREFQGVAVNLILRIWGVLRRRIQWLSHYFIGLERGGFVCHRHHFRGNGWFWVVKRVKVSVESAEDAWALKFINFITCANQLLFEGLTRELPLSFILHVAVQTLDDVVRYFRNTCSMLLPADNQMLLRYELQKDNSVIGEDQFAYDPDWLNGQIQGSLKFWLGEREASFTPEEERWKCRFCQFASVCPVNTTPGTSSP